jgi:thioredoxin reductase/bacterioferritin-associated ferredoxin
MNTKTELVVIGAGPGGIQAAVTAAKFGVDVTLIDSSFVPGGQYYKQLPKEFLKDNKNHLHKKAEFLFTELKRSSVHVFMNSVAWGIFHNPKSGLWQVKLQCNNCSSQIEAPIIIIATGAYDRSIAFPGWNLPGVMTAGAAQTMIKNQGILPGKRALLSGSGPLQLAAAANLVDAGAEVIAVLECGSRLLRKGISHIPAVWGQWGRMHEGLGYAGTLVKAKVPYKLGWSVIKAMGNEKVEEVVIAKVDEIGKPIKGSIQTHDVDALIVGYGLTPSTEFFRLLNCEMKFSPSEGIYIPDRNEYFETSLPGIFAVGDCAGIGGAELAMVEAKITAKRIAWKLGHVSNDQSFKIESSEIRALKKEQRFAKMLGQVFTIPQGLFKLAEEDTIICRCEQVTLSEVNKAISYGAQSVTDIKTITRSGMGNCQGRTCGSILAQILAAELGKPVETSQFLNIRPPVHPLLIEQIEENAQPEVTG